MAWIRAAALDELDSGPLTVNQPPRQIVVFTVDGEHFAIDNRCPHEGYPLSAGTVSDAPDCVVTCNWHNWKFRLADGECLLGGDHVRSYPTKTAEGQLWIDVSDPPLEVVRAEVMRGLRTAYEERDFGRICRELARLHYHGIDPREGVTEAIGWSHDRLEFGTTHSMAATADWLSLADRVGDDLERGLICLAEAVDHYAFDCLREPSYPYPDPDPEPFDRAAFLDSVEAEDHRRAEALAARALEDGLHWSDLEETLAEAALAHYNDFGHSAIYVAKAGELVERLGSGVERSLVLPLVRSIAYAFREDLIPEFRSYAPAIAGLPAAGTDVSRPPIPFPVSTAEAFTWLAEHLATHTAEAVYDSLLEALALSMLQFDTRYGQAYDRPVSQNVSWLDFTHGLTFANACRVLASRHPRLWPQALAQMACFLGRNRSFVLTEFDRTEWAVGDADAFFSDVRERLLDHGMRDPIFSSHLLKTSTAVAAELEFASPPCRAALVASLNRFLNSPIKTKHVRRLARQAIALVARDFPKVSSNPREKSAS